VLTVSKSDEDPRVRMLHVEKSNLAADDLPDVRYVIRGYWPDTGVTWQLQDAAGPAQQRILTTVSAASGDLKLQDIAKRSGVPYDSARVLVGRLVKQGLVSPAGWGTYTAAGIPESDAFSRIADAASCGNTAPDRA
jgi:hypothetical protein